MAIQLSAWLCLRNNGLGYLTDKENKRHYKWSGVSDEDIKSLQEIIKQVDELHSESTFLDVNDRMIGPHVDVPVTARYEEFSKDPKESAKLFTKIHDILKKYRISSDIYRRLGEAFKEIGAVPEGEVEEAIAYGTEMHNYCRRHYREDEFCWETVKKYGRKFVPF